MKNKIFTSWDDGHPLDLKIAELLEKYKIPGIFFIPLKNPERKVMSKSQIRKLSKKFEIGAHTVNHVDLTKVSLKKAREEIVNSKKELEEIIGKKVEWFCYPKGKYNKKIINLVEEAGFRYARTASWFHTEELRNQFIINPTIHFYPHGQIVNLAHLLKEKNWTALKVYLENGLLTSPFALSKIFFEKAIKENGIFHLWGHSWEIEKLGLWDELENVFQLINLY